MVTGDSNRHANATIVVLVTVAVVSISLASYLTLTASQNTETTWSQYWNLEMPIAEAGVEEALSHLNTSGLTDRSANGWNPYMAYFTKSRFLNTNSYYVSKISNDPDAVIISEGYIRAPMKTNFMNPRRIQVNTQRLGVFEKALVAKGRIDFLGNDVDTDSFDSSNPLFSTAGQYDPAKKNDKGDVATNATITNSLSIGEASICGHVSTGPGGSISIGANGSVGSVAWVSNPLNAGRIQPGWDIDDMNVSFPDAKVPFTSGFSVCVGTPFFNLTSSGNWKITGNLFGTLTVKSNVQAVLHVTGNVTMTGSSDKIDLQPGSSLKMYVQGTIADIRGKGVINAGGNATNFFYFGLPSNTNVAYSGTNAFMGAIYAPNADLTLGGGGVSPQSFVGASITKTAKMTNHFKLHYDENLAKRGPSRGYVVTNWVEM